MRRDLKEDAIDAGATTDVDLAYVFADFVGFRSSRVAIGPGLQTIQGRKEGFQPTGCRRPSRLPLEPVENLGDVALGPSREMSLVGHAILPRRRRIAWPAT